MNPIVTSLSALIKKIGGWVWWQAFCKTLVDGSIPAVISFGIVLYGHFNSKELPNAFAAFFEFFKVLFFVWGYIGIFQRSKKLVVDQINHLKVSTKQDTVLERLENLAEALSGRQDKIVTKLENLTDDLVGHSTGGDSFAYIVNVAATQHPSTLISEPPILTLGISVNGKYPLRDLRLRIRYAETEELGLAKLNATRNVTLTGVTAMLMTSDREMEFGYMRPTEGYITRTLRMPPPLPKANCIRLRTRWTALNGGWSQFLQLERVHGSWEYATRVQRNGDILYIAHSPNYPLDDNKNPILIL